MTIDSTFARCAERLVRFMTRSLGASRISPAESEAEFNSLAVEWFGIQYQHNAAYRCWCEALGVEPQNVSEWRQIPAMPTSGFKELEVTSLAVDERTRVFHSSGTTEQRPSRHFHSTQSLALYEVSLVTWFRRCLLEHCPGALRMISLTPGPEAVPNSSLVHMFETLRRECGTPDSAFCGSLNGEGAWELNTPALDDALLSASAPVFLVGTAFSFVNWIDTMIARDVRFQLPTGSRVLETGGYKGRSRSMPKDELHTLLCERLGVTAEAIVCEYGMSELSSQAYDVPRTTADGGRAFHFPPWARALIFSPETGREVAEGETGLVRIIDLANLWSVSAVQTEDLAVRRGAGFELIGRAAQAEPRGCSLMNH